jgi:hypothetical protein
MTNKITMRRRDFLAAGAGVGMLPLLGGRAFAASPITLPKIDGPLPGTIEHGAVVWRVDGLGYIAEEYFVSGKANVTDPVTMADAPEMSKRNTPLDLGRRDFTLTTVAKDRPYVTRVIVYRPADPARASGRVIVEALHPNGGGKPTVWTKMNGFFIANGDTCVHVQHPITFAVVKAEDPVRYSRLQAEHTTQIWGMLRDVGALLKSPVKENPLRMQRIDALYMTGYSYTGVATATFANFHHDKARLANGKPIYDAYLPMANATFIRPLDVPVSRMNTQSDFNSFGGTGNRSPDSDDPASRRRLYEVPGAAHQRNDLIPAQPFAIEPKFLADAANPVHNRPGGSCQSTYPALSHPNDFPLYGYSAAYFTNMYGWVEHGVAPPAGFLIETTADDQARLDRFGNALGGLRSAELTVPVATYGIGKDDCLLSGYNLPFTPAALKELYGDTATYTKKVADATALLVEQRLLSKEGAGDARDRAAQVVF